VPRQRPLLAPVSIESAAPIAGIYSDAEILAIIDEANQTDSAAAYDAYTRATLSVVRRYAARLLRDDHALRERDQRLARRGGVVLPMMIADDPIHPAVDSQAATLRRIPSGVEFDRTFVTQEIELHRSRLELEEQLRGSTDNLSGHRRSNS
jgi:predicted outer membrane protein